MVADLTCERYHRKSPQFIGFTAAVVRSGVVSKAFNNRGLAWTACKN